ncbi:MAG TPA: hypothetical protein VLE91_02575 [Candidatus Saccharimonadales bacterium]|nr:hypothetical protein [Candidatus Saccharimonadales bacterium]
MAEKHTLDNLRRFLDNLHGPKAEVVLQDPSNAKKYIAIREVEIDGFEISSLLGVRESMEEAYALLPGWQRGHEDYIYLPIESHKRYRTKRMIRDSDGTQYWRPGEPEGY